VLFGECPIHAAGAGAEQVGKLGRDGSFVQEAHLLHVAQGFVVVFDGLVAWFEVQIRHGLFPF
jgi:hypothetical protein